MYPDSDHMLTPGKTGALVWTWKTEVLQNYQVGIWCSGALKLRGDISPQTFFVSRATGVTRLCLSHNVQLWGFAERKKWKENVFTVGSMCMCECI